MTLSQSTVAPLVKSVGRRATYYAYAARARAVRMFAHFGSTSHQKRKLLILDPSLVGYADHHAEFAEIINRHLSVDFDVKIYANFAARSGLLAKLGGRPVFFGSIYPPSRGGNFEATYGSMTRFLVQGLRQVEKHDLQQSTFAIMHTATLFQLGGLAEWLSTLAPSQRPELLVIFHAPLEKGIDAVDLPSAFTAARKAVAELTAGSVVRFASLTDSLSQSVSKHLGEPCTTVPLPVQWPQLGPPAARSPAQPIFGFFGGLRVEKGAALLADAIPRFTERYVDTHFIIHAPPNAASDPQALQSLKGNARIELIRKSFRQKDAYFGHFRRAGCILVPYDPASYAARTSLVFFEALGLGKMIITTKGTSLEAEIAKREAHAILMPRFTADDLFGALERARLALLRASSVSQINKDVMDAHSPATFCKALVEVMAA